MDKNTLEQIKRGDLVESAVERLTAAIVTGRLQPGDKLVESAVADQLGVSRAPVREAIRRLEQIGLVEKIPYRGTSVATMEIDDVQELHDLREPMEGLAARLVAERQESEAIAALETLIAQMAEFSPATEQAKMITLDADFHDSLICYSRHKLLQELWVPVSVRLRRFLALKPKRLYTTSGEAAALHEPIVSAIRARNAAGAEEAARQHVAKAGRQHVLDWHEIIQD